MQRRTCIKRLFAVPAVLATPVVSYARQTGQASASPLRIDGVELWRLEGTREEVRGPTGQHQVQPLHIYPEYRPEPFQPAPPRTTEGRTSAIYLKIRTNQGLDGLYGPVDSEAVVVVERQLKSFLIGKDPLAGEVLWEQLFRRNRHSRAGHYMMGLSAVDNALWDLRGRYYEAPVYRLLGGPSRDPVEVYGSALGFSVDPALAAEKARELQADGFQYQKWFLAYGPADGPEGMQKNVALVEALREAVGYDVELMFDAFMGWDLTYAMRWAEQVEQFHPRWIEEAIHPSKLDSFVQLSHSTTIPIATGEHFYNRWEVNEFLEAGAIQVVQADPEWCGGVSELVKICALASAYDVHVVPHGHSLHAALHTVASQSPMTCPLVEFLINKMQGYYHFENYQIQLENGNISLPDRPGFGIQLDESRIENRVQLHWS